MPTITDFTLQLHLSDASKRQLLTSLQVFATEWSENLFTADYLGEMIEAGADTVSLQLTEFEASIVLGALLEWLEKLQETQRVMITSDTDHTATQLNDARIEAVNDLLNQIDAQYPQQWRE